MDVSVREWIVPVRRPYRLDLTATVLRRLSTNIVDVFDGYVYRRMIGDSTQPVRLDVEQAAPDSLRVRVTGDPSADVPSLVARMLGADVDLSEFYAAADAVPWLARIVTAARGVKPPRYPSLWEAIVNAVVFQQVSIHAAAAILRRVIERYEPLRQAGNVALAAFVAPQIIVDADALELRGLGLSVNKLVALRTLGRAVLEGELDAAKLESVATDELVARLATFKGIGPWTAAVIALRGFGRLDIFPMNDSGVARSLRELSGDPDIDGGAILKRLGAQRGMLYYHLLLGRLAARGDIVLGEPTGGSAVGGPR
jgi:DNA-3-methyladenine glycosylase II